MMESDVKAVMADPLSFLYILRVCRCLSQHKVSISQLICQKVAPYWLEESIHGHSTSQDHPLRVRLDDNYP